MSIFISCPSQPRSNSNKQCAVYACYPLSLPSSHSPLNLEFDVCQTILQCNFPQIKDSTCSLSPLAPHNRFLAHSQPLVEEKCHLYSLKSDCPSLVTSANFKFMIAKQYTTLDKPTAGCELRDSTTGESYNGTNESVEAIRSDGESGSWLYKRASIPPYGPEDRASELFHSLFYIYTWPQPLYTNDNNLYIYMTTTPEDRHGLALLWRVG